MTDAGGAGGDGGVSLAPGPWVAAADGVLRGMAHQLSNRVGTVGAVAETLTAGAEPGALAGTLAAEAVRLGELLRLLRLMPRDPDRPAEPARPVDVVADAAALFALHESGRGAPVAMVDLHDAPPVRVRVPSLTHALLVLFAAAAGDAGAPVSVRGAGDGDVVRLIVTGDSATGPEADAAAAAARALLAADGATVAADGITGDGPAFVVGLPSLRSGRA